MAIVRRELREAIELDQSFDYPARSDHPKRRAQIELGGVHEVLDGKVLRFKSRQKLRQTPLYQLPGLFFFELRHLDFCTVIDA